jgi:hypothetical protein
MSVGLSKPSYRGIFSLNFAPRPSIDSTRQVPFHFVSTRSLIIESPIPEPCHVKKKSLIKVQKGLSSLERFTSKLTQK